jgi:hypothetical protein
MFCALSVCGPPTGLGWRQYADLMSWFSDTGKLLLIGAGLVAWLDVSGPAKVKGWAERAETRHHETTERRDQLKAVRPDQKLVRQAARWAMYTPPGAEGAGIGPSAPQGDDAVTAGDFQAFRQEAWTLIWEDPRYCKSTWRIDSRLTFPFFEEQAYRFFTTRLPKPRGDMLDRAYQELLGRERRWDWISNVFVLAILPLTAVLSWWFHTGDISWWASALVAYMFVGMAGFSARAALLTPRFIAGLLWSAATVRLGLAEAAVRAMGEEGDGRPLRKVALGIFIVGSLLDLIGGWSN